MPNRQPSHEVCVRLAVEVGAMDEAEGEQGVAHLVEHIVFMGSRDFDEAGGSRRRCARSAARSAPT